MKKEKREIYISLAEEIDWPLCAFCKYDESTPGSICDMEPESECVHPLSDRITWPWWEDSPDPGSDCWGFRPLYNVSFCADIVGACIANKWDVAQWWKDDRGEWKIFGKTYVPVQYHKTGRLRSKGGKLR